MLRRGIKRLLLGERPYTAPAMEAVYQQIVQRDLARIGLDDRFYPVGSAANYGLFYVLIRAVTDFPIRSVMELGVGQSSLLLNGLSDAKALNAEIVSIEHDEAWARQVAGNVRHRVLKTELVEKEIEGRHIAGYDLAPVDMNTIEMLMIDGPPAYTPRTCYSRLGALELLNRLDTSRFIILLDDAQRAGETLLARKIEERLTALRIDHARGEINASRRQVIFAGGAYKAAAYY